jgi:hypothetical protein
VLDLNGFKLAGNAGSGTGAVGIHAVDRQNITIRNGTIRGFREAVAIEGGGMSRGHLVEHIRADSNFVVGINVSGAGCIIQNNQIVNTGGTTFYGPGALTLGIFASGTTPRILNNDIAGMVQVGSSPSYAIEIFQATDAFIVNNRVASAPFGIIAFGTGSKCRDNIVSVTDTAYYGCNLVSNNF